VTFYREVMTECKNLIHHYLDGNVAREKQALYALQYLMHRMEHPNCKLEQFFEQKQKSFFFYVLIPVSVLLLK
jgi:hypothetical protein